jgi:hypothetical protein
MRCGIAILAATIPPKAARPLGRRRSRTAHWHTVRRNLLLARACTFHEADGIGESENAAVAPVSLPTSVTSSSASASTSEALSPLRPAAGAVKLLTG